MKTKHRLLSLLMLGAIIALLTYSAWARHNQLSSQQMSFSSLSSNQNNNQLKAHMRDALISKLNTRASNHELRIATYAQSSSHPQLSSQQLSFNSYLSTNNNNMLTAHMRDNLTTQFGNTISNHEMRIRCIEDGTCLNTSHCPTTPSNPSPEEWHCVGNYNEINNGTQLCVQDTEKTDPYVTVWYSPYQKCLEEARRWVDYFDNAYPSKYDYCKRHYPFPERVRGQSISEKSRYRYSDPNPYNSLSLQYTYRGLNIGDGNNIVSCQIATYPDWSYICDINCEKHSARYCDLKRCKISPTSTPKSCSQFDQSTCQNTSGCFRVRK